MISVRLTLRSKFKLGREQTFIYENKNTSMENVLMSSLKQMSLS
jgi:hypothetical protein